MKILMVTAGLPYPPHQGGALRTYGIIQGLHKLGHEITLLSLDSRAAQEVKDSPLAQYCRQIKMVAPPSRSKSERLRNLILSREADISRRLYTDELTQALKQIMEQDRFDLIQFEGIEVACYLPLAKAIFPDVKMCYDAFNAEAALQRVIYEVDRTQVKRWPMAFYSFIQSGRIEQFERMLCKEADLVIAVSSEDAAILAQYQPAYTIPVVPNGIFTHDYEWEGEKLDLGQHALVFTGKMDYRPNMDAVIWFSKEILPEIQAIIPAVRFYVVGQRPHPEVEKLRDLPGIQITGWVKDVQPFLHGAAIYVAPLRMGSGTRLKILEAMAAGCAVVATPLAASGIRNDEQNGMSIAKTEQEMISTILALLNQTEKRDQMGQAAQDYVKRHYDWSVLIPQLIEAYKGIGLG